MVTVTVAPSESTVTPVAGFCASRSSIPSSKAVGAGSGVTVPGVSEEEEEEGVKLNEAKFTNPVSIHAIRERFIRFIPSLTRTANVRMPVDSS